MIVIHRKQNNEDERRKADIEKKVAYCMACHREVESLIMPRST